jgi:hypothetical protein
LIKSVISLILLFRSSAVLLLASIFLFISESSFSALFLSATVCFLSFNFSLNSLREILPPVATELLPYAKPYLAVTALL